MLLHWLASVSPPLFFTVTISSIVIGLTKTLVDTIEKDK